MATASFSALELMDQRLDALDRALLGLLPRGERLAFVASIETKIREMQDANPAAVENLAAATEETLPEVRPAVTLGREGRRKRSRLALTSGILGITVLALLFALPVTYVVIATMAEAMGELISYALISANILAIAFGGAAALAMAITALVRLSGSKSQKRGIGWAITGICTAPAPMLVGFLATLMVVFPLAMELADNGGGSSGPVINMTAESGMPVAPMVPPIESGMPVYVQNVAALPSYPAPADRVPQTSDCVPPSLCLPVQDAQKLPPSTESSTPPASEKPSLNL